jgi:hypothetical protein
VHKQLPHTKRHNHNIQKSTFAEKRGMILHEMPYTRGEARFCSMPARSFQNVNMTLDTSAGSVIFTL